MTLKEALQYYYQANTDILYRGDKSVGSVDFFRCYDVAHVVFGCDTSWLNEAMVNIWTVFGTAMRFWGHIRAYSREETREIAKTFRWRSILRVFLWSFVKKAASNRQMS